MKSAKKKRAVVENCVSTPKPKTTKDKSRKSIEKITNNNNLSEKVEPESNFPTRELKNKHTSSKARETVAPTSAGTCAKISIPASAEKRLPAQAGTKACSFG